MTLFLLFISFLHIWGMLPVCVCVCVCMCIYIYIYTHTYIYVGDPQFR